MKRTLPLLCLILSSILFAHISVAQELTEHSVIDVENRYEAPQGYRGFVELTPAQVTTSGIYINLHTVHGKQLRHSLFLGGGVGINYLYNSKGFVNVPIYFAIQSNVGRKFAQFTYGGRLGLIAYDRHDYVDSYGNLEIYEGGGFYSQFNLGLRLGFSPEFALSIKPHIEFSVTGFFRLGAGLTIGAEF